MSKTALHILLNHCNGRQIRQHNSTIPAFLHTWLIQRNERIELHLLAWNRSSAGVKNTIMPELLINSDTIQNGNLHTVILFTFQSVDKLLGINPVSAPIRITSPRVHATAVSRPRAKSICIAGARVGGKRSTKRLSNTGRVAREIRRRGAEQATQMIYNNGGGTGSMKKKLYSK